MEREITAPVELWTADGVARPEAIGWTRRPLHACRLERPWGRRKRWHHWCVTSAEEVVAITLADLDYVGVGAIVVHDRTTGQRWRAVTVRPLGWGVDFPARERGRVAVRRGDFALELDDRGEGGARLVAAGKGIAVEVEVERPPGHQTLAVAVAPDLRHARYSAKHNTLPARGWLALDGARRRIGAGAFATLDWGRGVWPVTTAWNWASASGVEGGRTIGINLGARWTAGGPTENAVCVDGVLTKLDGEVAFGWDRRDPRRPWRLIGPAVDLTFTPEIVDGAAGPGGLPGWLRLCFGAFRGRAGDVEVASLFGWAEELCVRW